jgi:YggT family protein
VGAIYEAPRWGVKGSPPGGLAAPARELYTSAASAPGGIGQMLELLAFISYLLTLYIYVLFAAVIMSWLIAFNVVNPRNQFVGIVAQFLYRITEPVLRPIRNRLPDLGGIDLSPLVVILVIFFIQAVIIPNIAKALT